MQFSGMMEVRTMQDVEFHGGTPYRSEQALSDAVGMWLGSGIWSEPDERVLRGHFVEGLSVADTAAASGMSEGLARRVIEEAVAKLPKPKENMAMLAVRVPQADIEWLDEQVKAAGGPRKSSRSAQVRLALLQRRISLLPDHQRAAVMRKLGVDRKQASEDGRGDCGGGGTDGADVVEDMR